MAVSRIRLDDAMDDMAVDEMAADEATRETMTTRETAIDNETLTFDVNEEEEAKEAKARQKQKYLVISTHIISNSRNKTDRQT